MVCAQAVKELPAPLGTLTVDDGLSQGLVYGGIQDKDGLIWLATADGLNRYDGSSFKIYRHNPDDPYSLPENFITQVAEDGNGNLWVGTMTKGLFLFDRFSEKFYPVPLPYVSLKEQAHSIFTLQYHDKRLYAGLPDNLIVINTEKISPGYYAAGTLTQRLKMATILPVKSGEFMKGFYMQENSFWNYQNDTATFFSPDAALQHWTGKSFTAHDLRLASISPESRFYKYPGENKICILNENKIYVYDLERRTLVFQQSLESTGKYCWIHFAAIDGKLIFSNPDLGHCIYELNLNSYELKKYTFSNDIKHRDVLFKDKTGVLWMNTDAAGMALFNRHLNVFHKHSIGRYVYGSKTMLTCYNQEIFEFSTETGINKVVIPKKDFSPKYFEFVFEFIDHNGIYWRVKSKSTLLSYNSNTKKFREYDLGFQNIFLLFEDKKNYLWVMQLGIDKDNYVYLSKMDTAHTKVLQTFKFPVLLPFRDTRFLTGYWQDANEVFWFATISGLFRFNPDANDEKKIWKQWKNIPGDNTSLASDQLNCICPDVKASEKYLWLGTRGSGFDRFEIATGKCLHYTDKDELPNNVAYDILPDEFGNLWISTNKGLSCFTLPTRENQKGTFRNFTEQDGIAGNEFNMLGGKKLATGELFFQGVKGTTWFRPAEVLQQQPAAPILFTSLSLNNKEVNWKEDSTTLPAPVSYAKTITLEPGEKIFSIRFETIDFRNKSNKLYKYYLERFDKTRLAPGTKNEATYTNLNPGHYVFHVTGTNCDGVWNKKGNSIEVIVLPEWYQTLWFKILVFLFIAGGLYGFYRYRLRQAIKLMKLRNRIAGDLHDEIGSTLSSISMFGEVARKTLRTKPAEADVLLRQINDSTTEMMESMSDIVWTINTSNDKFSNVVNRMRAFAVQVLESKDIALNMEVDDAFQNLKLDMVQRKNIYLILKEAINNAAKYSQCKNVWIEVIIKHNLLLIIIKDDGKGFATELPADGILGGNGIHNMKSRAAELGGEVEIISEGGKGTSVKLHLKI